jgi:diguanylate cyclase (GGDEF)-like protein/PAS domain S-box-containing protein
MKRSALLSCLAKRFSSRTMLRRKQAMSLRTVKLALAAIIGCFAIAATYISVLVIERQNALKQVARYNVSWGVSQAVSEFLRLEQRIGAFGLPGSGVDKDEIELRLDILASRSQLLGEGEFHDFLRRDPARMAVVAKLKQAVANTEKLLPDLHKPGAVKKAIALLSPLDAKLAGLASAANAFGGERVSEDQNELLRLHRLFSGVAGGLILCGFIMIALLVRHNQLLGKAHRDLHILAANLRKTSVDLEAANAAVNAANAELQGQNEALQSQEFELRRQNDRFDAALNNMSHALCMADAAERVIVCNDRFLSLFDLRSSDVEPGTTLTDVIANAPRNDGLDHLAQIYGEQSDMIRDRRAAVFVHGRSDGRTIAVSHRPMAHGGWVATYEDITERKRAESQIAYMAHHDALTDLANRVLFREHIERTLAQAKRRGDAIAMICLDLDHFKTVNDTLGHQAGDAVLKAVGDRLRSCVRQGDVIARLGGDEFAVLQVAPNQPHDAAALAARLVQAIGAPYHIEGQEVVIGTSVGVALSDDQCFLPDQLLKRADLALYRAKGDGRGTCRFFEAEMDAQLHARRALETDLRKALANGEFELFYQPQVTIATSEVRGYEALVRWHHPERGLVPPSEFIPVAEETGLVAQLGNWVVHQACREAAAWPAGLNVAVNLSPVQFRGRTLVDTIVSALQTSGLAPGRLEVEITESVLLENNEATVDMLHQLRALGVRVALDDFGTGYSSLSYLRSFPFDKIKIDQSFVRELSTRADCLAIVQSITRLGASLRMTTIAEGVETEEQVRQLRAAGCVEAQGYLFGHPKPADEIVHAESHSATQAA